MSKDLTVKNSNYLAEGGDLSAMMADEMDGMPLSFERIKIPAGGGIAFEVPGDDADSPDSVKEFKAVILHHHPINTYYKDKYDGSNNPPDCGSMDGRIGVKSDGELLECAECPLSKFGSGEDGKGKACKQKRRLYILREGELLPTVMTLPTGSLGEYSKYIMRLMNKGKKSNSIVTKFSLKKAQNATGINYSQAVFAVERELDIQELQNISKLSEQVKAFAQKTEVIDEAE
jgi:hypothetical protein